MTSVIAAEAWPSDVCGAADDRRVTGTTVCKLILALLQVSNFSLVDANPHLEQARHGGAGGWDRWRVLASLWWLWGDLPRLRRVSATHRQNHHGHDADAG